MRWSAGPPANEVAFKQEVTWCLAKWGLWWGRNHFTWRLAYCTAWHGV